MNIGVRVTVSQRSPALLADIARVEACGTKAWRASAAPSWPAPNSLPSTRSYAPVVFRFQTFGVPLTGAAANYQQTMLAHPAMQAWQTAALAEDFRDLPHDEELPLIGTVTADLRVPAR